MGGEGGGRLDPTHQGEHPIGRIDEDVDGETQRQLFLHLCQGA